MPETPRIRASVVHAERDSVYTREFELPQGASVADAIEHSGIRAARPGLEIRADRVGIFGRKVTMDTVLHDGDRVEIYRPLKIDPKEARRRRARTG